MRQRRSGFIGAICSAALLFSCSDSKNSELAPTASLVPTATATPTTAAIQTAPKAVSAEVKAAVERIVPSLQANSLDASAIDAIGASGDARLAWILTDVMRFGGEEDYEKLAPAFNKLTGKAVEADVDLWRQATDELIVLDTPAPPAYREFKAQLFTALEPRWGIIFNDADADMDWRFLSWGGVLPDDRKLGEVGRCIRGCIPSLDDPVLTPSSEGDWYPDDRFVFVVSVNGEHVAFPKNIMEVHEMVNITIGGRRVAIPYCTLCGSAQAFYTDRVAGRSTPLVLRTSGLLSLSNKVMYDLETKSTFDTFTGRAVAGPLQDGDVTLPRATTIVTRWGDWRKAHEDTRIVNRKGGVDEEYPLDPLRGRDDNGPIFPIRRSDSRLSVHTQVLGVVAEDGTHVAFPVDAAQAELKAGRSVSAHGITITADGGGLRAFPADSTGDAEKELTTHQAFWFAWAQFQPDTKLWSAS